MLHAMVSWLKRTTLSDWIRFLRDEEHISTEASIASAVRSISMLRVVESGMRISSSWGGSARIPWRSITGSRVSQLSAPGKIPADGAYRYTLLGSLSTLFIQPSAASGTALTIGR